MTVTCSDPCVLWLVRLWPPSPRLSGTGWPFVSPTSYFQGYLIHPTLGPGRFPFCSPFAFLVIDTYLSTHLLPTAILHILSRTLSPFVMSTPDQLLAWAVLQPFSRHSSTLLPLVPRTSLTNVALRNRQSPGFQNDPFRR